MPIDARRIPDEVDVLLIVHPVGLNRFTRYAIDQFVIRGGRALVFVDPVAEAEAAGDRIVSQIDLHPDVKERISKAFEVRQRIGIYGAGGQAHDGFYTISSAHNQAIFEYCFGMIWNQPLLDMKTKELIVIAASTANQCDNELEWHVRSALNAGLTRDEIVEAITQCSPYIGLSKTNQGLRAAKKAFEALDGHNA